MTNARNWVVGIVLGVVLLIVLFAAVALVAAVLVDDPTGADGEGTAAPIATEATGPIGELEPVEGEREDAAVPLGDETPDP